MTSIRLVLGLVLIATLATLSLTHVYWALGGRCRRGAAVPSRDGTPLFRPSPLATLMVALALLVAVLVICGALGWLDVVAPPRAFRWLTLAMSVVFLLRAVGDFTRVGFFKRRSDTPFDYWDSWLFSPLCLFISAAAFIVGWWTTA